MAKEMLSLYIDLFNIKHMQQ